MGRLKKACLGVGFTFVAAFYLIASLLGLAIHVWTIIIAYSLSGLIAAIISLSFPVFSEIYWGFKIWAHTGSFINFYCLSIIGYLIFWIVIIIVGFSLTKFTDE